MSHYPDYPYTTPQTYAPPPYTPPPYEPSYNPPQHAYEFEYVNGYDNVVWPQEYIERYEDVGYYRAPLSEEYIQWAIKAYDDGTLPSANRDEETMLAIEQELQRRRDLRRAREEKARAQQEARAQQAAAIIQTMDRLDAHWERLLTALAPKTPAPTISMTPTHTPPPSAPQSAPPVPLAPMKTASPIAAPAPTPLDPKPSVQEIADSRSNPFEEGEDDVILTELPTLANQVIMESIKVPSIKPKALPKNRALKVSMPKQKTVLRHFSILARTGCTKFQMKPMSTCWKAILMGYKFHLLGHSKIHQEMAQILHPNRRPKTCSRRPLLKTFEHECIKCLAHF